MDYYEFNLINPLPAGVPIRQAERADLSELHIAESEEADIRGIGEFLVHGNPHMDRYRAGLGELPIQWGAIGTAAAG